MKEILTLGEPMVVYMAEAPGSFREVSLYSRGLAGAELNFSTGAVRLGHGVSYFTRLGCDPYGEYIKSFIDQEGIDGSSIVWDSEHLTGSYLKSRVTDGDPAVAYFRKNSAASHISAKDIERLSFDNVRLLHITGITLALSQTCREACTEAAVRAKDRGAWVMFDPNIREMLWSSREEMRRCMNAFAARCSIVLPGINEGKILTGLDTPEEIADFYLERGTEAVIVKLGAQGAYYKTKDVQGTVPGFRPEKIVDTVGAGDAFAAGTATALLEGLSLEEAVSRGNAMGAVIISSRGDNDNLPDRQTLQSFMSSQR